MSATDRERRIKYIRTNVRNSSLFCPPQAKWISAVCLSSSSFCQQNPLVINFHVIIWFAKRHQPNTRSDFGIRIALNQIFAHANVENSVSFVVMLRKIERCFCPRIYEFCMIRISLRVQRGIFLDLVYFNVIFDYFHDFLTVFQLFLLIFVKFLLLLWWHLCHFQ